MQAELQKVFDPQPKTVLEVFEGSSYYRVPEYQRPYSWTNEHVEKLWDDIRSASENPDDVYFLGPVILSGVKKGRLDIIDGQQRLTSLTILFCVLRDFFKEHLGPNVKRIESAVRSLRDEKFRLRLITQANYQNKFEQEILEGVRLDQVSAQTSKSQQNNFSVAAEIFHRKLSELEPHALQDFVDYLLTKVAMITITCSSRASAVQLFRVINTRGLDLSNADLIKSDLYGRLKEGDRAAERKFMSTWTQVEILAKHLGETLTGLFTYYEYSLLASNPRKSLYEELERIFREQFKNDSNKIMYDFQKFCEGYDGILNLSTKSLHSLSYLPNQVFWKAILSTACHKGLSKAEIRRLTNELRRFYYSYWIAGYTTSKIKQPSFNIVRWLKDGIEVKEIAKRLDKKMRKDDVEKWLDESLDDSEVYGASWLKPVLVLVEYNQTDDSKPTFIPIDRNLHVDHVLPQKWDSTSQWRQLWKKEEANQHLNSLGNITLLSGKKNIKASNSPFDEKKRIYRGKGYDGMTGFRISQRIVRKRKWTPQRVRERAKWLKGEIRKVLNER